MIYYSYYTGIYIHFCQRKTYFFADANPEGTGRDMKKRVRKVLIVILALVFVTSVGVLLHQRQTYRAGEDIYARAEQLAQQPPASTETLPEPAVTGQTPQLPVSPDGTQTAPPSDEPPAAETEPVQADGQSGFSLESLSIAALRQVSPDTVGWIKIPGTAISYPLVRGEDNDYYLNHAWDGTPTRVGAIFMDHRNAADLTDFHTLIYGHRMKNATMFTALDCYESLSFRDEHPYVYIKLDGQVITYAVFAAYEAPVRSVVYDLTLSGEAEKQALIDFALEQSVIDTGIVPTVNDRVLTLSTCTGRGYESRWVVQCVRLGNGAPD